MSDVKLKPCRALETIIGYGMQAEQCRAACDVCPNRKPVSLNDLAVKFDNLAWKLQGHERYLMEKAARMVRHFEREINQ